MKRSFVVLLAIYWVSSSLLAAAATNRGLAATHYAGGHVAIKSPFARFHGTVAIADYIEQLKAKAAKRVAKLL